MYSPVIHYVFACHSLVNDQVMAKRLAEIAENEAIGTFLILYAKKKSNFISHVFANMVPYKHMLFTML